MEQEKDREKGKVGGRPAKLNEKKNKGDIFFVGRTTWKLCSSGDKMRNASGHQCTKRPPRWKWAAVKKKGNDSTYNISTKKTCNKEVSNDIWNKSYMNCEMKMKKWSSQWTQFMQLRKEAWKKFRTSTGFEPVTSRILPPLLNRYTQDDNVHIWARGQPSPR